MSLKTWGILLIALLILTTGISINLYSTNFIRNQEESHFKENSLTMARLMSAYALTAIKENNDLLLFSYLDEVVKNRNVVYGYVIEKSGEVIAHTDSNKIGTALKLPQIKEKPYVMTTYQNEEVFEVSSEIKDMENIIGYSVLGISLKEFYGINEKARKELIILTGGLIILSIIIVSFFAAPFSKKLKDIEKSIKMAGEKIWQQELKNSNVAEINAIVKSLQELYISLQKQVSHIETGSQQYERAMTKKLDNLVNSIGQFGILVTDENNKIVIANQKASEICNTTLQDKHILEAFQNKDILELIRNSMKNKDSMITGAFNQHTAKLMTIGYDDTSCGTIIILE